MEITTIQMAEDASTKTEKEHPAIFTTDGSSLMKPEKTTAATEFSSLSNLETGNNRHKNEELLSKSIDWKSM